MALSVATHNGQDVGRIAGISRPGSQSHAKGHRCMSDGQFQIDKPNRPPTFVWRMIARRGHQTDL